jgi:uncharacterized protein YbaR (Trm112 family)
MACPECGCKCTYPYDDSQDDAMQASDGLERCAACGHVFELDDELPEDD